jgi:hypothetical protein
MPTSIALAKACSAYTVSDLVCCPVCLPLTPAARRHLGSFNPIQTQCFSALYNTDDNVLVSERQPSPMDGPPSRGPET